MRSLLVSLLLSLSACSPVLLSESTNPYHLPTIRGVVAIEQFTVKPGVRPAAFYQAARSWLQAHQEQYAVQPERPYYRATLLHSAQIPVVSLPKAATPVPDNRRVRYLITVDARADTCRILLNCFTVISANGRSEMVERTGG